VVSAVNVSHTIVKGSKYPLAFFLPTWKKLMTALSPGLCKFVKEKVPETPSGKMLPKKEAGIPPASLHKILFG
jgi:hypothetical protein